jgi:hypothetical protein
MHGQVLKMISWHNKMRQMNGALHNIAGIGTATNLIKERGAGQASRLLDVLFVQDVRYIQSSEETGYLLNGLTEYRIVV